MLRQLSEKYRATKDDIGFTIIFTGTLWTMLSRAGTLLLSLVGALLIGRFYGAEAMGILGIVISLVTVVTVFTEMGLGTSILKMLPEHESRYSATSAFCVYRKAQWLITGAALVATIIMYFMAGPIAVHIFDHDELRDVIAIASAFILLKSIMWLDQQATRGLKLIRMYAVLQLVPAIGFVLFLLIGLAWKRDEVPAYAQMLAWAFAGLLGAIVMQRAFRRRIKAGDVVHPVSWRQILVLSLPMFVTTSMTMVVGQTSVIVLGMYRPVDEVGYYAVAVRLATLTAFMLNAINTLSAPVYAELFHKGNHDELLRVARKSAQLVFWTTIPLLAILLLAGRPLLHMIRPEFVVAYPALLILLLGQFFNMCAGSTAIFMNMTGDQVPLRNIMIMTAIFHVIVSFGVIPRWGMLGAALASAASILFWNGAAVWHIVRRFGKTIGFVPRLRVQW